MLRYIARNIFNVVSSQNTDLISVLCFPFKCGIILDGKCCSSSEITPSISLNVIVLHCTNSCRLAEVNSNLNLLKDCFYI